MNYEFHPEAEQELYEAALHPTFRANALSAGDGWRCPMKGR